MIISFSLFKGIFPFLYFSLFDKLQGWQACIRNTIIATFILQNSKFFYGHDGIIVQDSIYNSIST